ncbi:iron zinc purple acid phosphatase [Brachionus plicatilis]|uniref:Purple acid phosphatase n=1 Tax=Brachionus plicatilis TaxID=10195 RepID=A0A3M7PID5_BRAPC|nr:iron zinc purple acid phosphatase [Brachionus plicatilis]
MINWNFLASLVIFFSLTDGYLNLGDTEILNEVYYQPEQVHLSYGARPDQMVVTWVTMSPVPESVVEYGIYKIDSSVSGTSSIFVDGGNLRRNMTVHRVVLEKLTPGKSYKYHCGSPKYGWSDIFYFTAMPEGTKWSPRFAIFGDLGNENAQSLPRLQDETMLGFYDSILHVGDFAYDMATDNARVGDAFFNQMQPIAAYVPYMTCPGNHEWQYNFSNYVSKFSMPNGDGTKFGGDNNLFYSINIGPIHLISFSTEFYYFFDFGFKQIVNQYKWLEEDLKSANLPENRALRPWIITMGHRPMYCTNANKDDCTNFDDRVRTGLPYVQTYGLEDLFYKYAVDVELWAHEHSYERLWPIYNYTVYNGSYEKPYTNPKAPIHIVTGSAGCKENHNPFGPQKDFCAFRANDYGYTRMQAFNNTHLYFEQVSDDKNGKIIDNFWIIKDKHDSYF